MRDSVMALARPFHGRDEPADTVQKKDFREAYSHLGGSVSNEAAMYANMISTSKRACALPGSLQTILRLSMRHDVSQPSCML